MNLSHDCIVTNSRECAIGTHGNRMQYHPLIKIIVLPQYYFLAFDTNLYYYTYYQDETLIVIEELLQNFVLSLFENFIIEQRKT